MFRIKNIRNNTVNKQTNLSPAVNQPRVTVGRIDNKVGNKLPITNKIGSRVIVNKKLNGNVGRITVKENKVLSRVQPHINVKLKNQLKKQQAPSSKQAANKKIEQNQLKQEQRRNQIKLQLKQKEAKVEQKINLKQPTKPLNIQTTQIQDIDQQKLQIFIKKEQQARKIAAELQKRREQGQLQRIKKEDQRQRKRQQRRRQEQKQRQRQLQLKKMMQKVQARKKARQEQFQKRKKQQEQRKRLSEQNGITGMVSLNDPLAHIEMSQAIMDRQINKLLSMKFPNFTNKQEIQHQIQELQRINTSYLLVRQDPNNPLIRGLSNFRIQLFNRVGESIMKGQAQIGTYVSGLQVIQTDSHQNNTRLVEGVKITRGLQNKVKKILKTMKLKNQQSCAICLGIIPTNEQVYSVKCGHIFHLNCLQHWLTNTANCPACRYNIKYDHY